MLSYSEHKSTAEGKSIKIGSGLLSKELGRNDYEGMTDVWTDDLQGFWQGSYKTVRTELKGRYPKHDWPENPINQEN